MNGNIFPMFDGYAFTLKGRSHSENNTPCQDNHIISRYYGEWHLLAVADSLKNANIPAQASTEALYALEEYCNSVIVGWEGRLDSTDGGIPPNILTKAFYFVHSRLERLSQIYDRSLSDYDTTLTACLYNGERLIIGHTGNGGIIGMDEDCNYHLLTNTQHDVWNNVCSVTAAEPIRQGQFVDIEKRYSAILLLTDGLFDIAAPSLLRTQEEPLFRRFVSMLLPPNVIGAKSDPEIPELERKIERWMASSRKETEKYSQREASVGVELENKLIQILSTEDYEYLKDDLTAVAIWKRNTKLTPPPKGYLDEPDWEALRRERYNRLYPQIKLKEEQNNAPKGVNP